MPVASKHRKTPPNADEPTPSLSITTHHGANTVEEPEIEVVAVRGPKFSCNIFNEPPSPTPIPPVSKIISPSTGDVVAANEDISFSSSPPSISEHPALRDSAPAASNQPHIPTAEAVTLAPGPVTKRRTETTGLDELTLPTPLCKDKHTKASKARTSVWRKIVRSPHNTKRTRPSLLHIWVQ
ncbi:uncharacterized protein MELLADRAFT_110718 [Melampsora larici-populina 98AG31]|uniref:Uncharacterized protein n=1 Tax=Melampsora larici-populina (strain 98AG31 / pathotype 3-4-7) TaxID=747676 RepID=F4S0Q7_MELLP|nr:uncharacterized protein MELLADRAFT_110718 [Melampsora larici-populina 98AG31]EGG01822.1 hypothetical protein MELLADRAFT_110718 [Melampsora larici-populina 98AG31]